MADDQMRIYRENMRIHQGTYLRIVVHTVLLTMVACSVMPIFVMRIVVFLALLMMLVDDWWLPEPESA